MKTYSDHPLHEVNVALSIIQNDPNIDLGIKKYVREAQERLNNLVIEIGFSSTISEKERGNSEILERHKYVIAQKLAKGLIERAYIEENDSQFFAHKVTNFRVYILDGQK